MLPVLGVLAASAPAPGGNGFGEVPGLLLVLMLTLDDGVFTPR